jgi:hypothetical protein
MKGSITMSFKIEEIQAIGSSFGKKLEAAKILSVDDLLDRCSDPQGRITTAAETGIDESQLLEWTKMADLMRITGVPPHAELLEAAGVDTVGELQNQSAQNLSTKMQEINDKKKLAATSPSSSTVQGWIDQAKSAEPRVSY